MGIEGLHYYKWHEYYHDKYLDNFISVRRLQRKKMHIISVHLLLDAFL